MSTPNPPLPPGRPTPVWLGLARLIDRVNELVGRSVFWLVGAATLISAANALVRYGAGMSSNAWLELQWYLFAAIFLLAAGYTLKHNAHVRVDLFYSRLSDRGRAWVDLLGALFFLLPFGVLVAWLSWPGFIDALRSNESSPDAGGLLRWPMRLMLPLGFGLLALQGVAEILKRIAFLRGIIPLPVEAPREDV